MSDPGKHVVTLPGFRWLGGMLVASPSPGSPPLRVCYIHGVHLIEGDDSASYALDDDITPTPDLDDPVTRLSILVLVREAWGDGWDVILEADNSVTIEAGPTIRRTRGDISHPFGDLVDALEAAP